MKKLLLNSKKYHFHMGFYGSMMLAVVVYLFMYSSCGVKTQTIQGPKGETGSTGEQGPSGSSGSSGLNGSNGTNGVAGADGKDGSNGISGASGHSAVFNMTTSTTCAEGGYTLLTAIDTNDSGVLDNGDSNIQSITVCNGLTGAKGDTGIQGIKGDVGDTGSQGVQGDVGPAGPSGYSSPFTPVRVITPCGPSSSPYKEVLLLLYDGNLLASFSDNVSGYNTRLALIPDGSYVDTDASACHFTISTIGNTRYIAWSGGGDSWSVL